MGRCLPAARCALFKEWNNTVLNLVKKAGGEYLPQVLELFGRQNISFSIDARWCGYLYLNEIIDSELVVNHHGQKTEICRFSSPFIQQRLFNALTNDLMGDRSPRVDVILCATFWGCSAWRICVQASTTRTRGSLYGLRLARPPQPSEFTL